LNDNYGATNETWSCIPRILPARSPNISNLTLKFRYSLSAGNSVSAFRELGAMIGMPMRHSLIIRYWSRRKVGREKEATARPSAQFAGDQAGHR
jgi:hypothetical protein